MRKQLTKTVSDIMDKDPKVIALLGDIGVFAFRDTFKKYPDRIYNIGILEQATVGLMSGLAMTGFVPIFHTIAPFMVERAYEQIKMDFSYQNLIGSFISVGGSYDYSALGFSHQSPADVDLLLTIPNMNIFVPGSPQEFNLLFRMAYKTCLGYYRLSERSHKFMNFFTTTYMRNVASKSLIITIGPLLDNVLVAANDLNYDIFYINTIKPFPNEIFNHRDYEEIVIISPFYEGTMYSIIMPLLNGRKCSVYDLSVKRDTKEYYGTVEQHDAFHGLDPQSLRKLLTDKK